MARKSRQRNTAIKRPPQALAATSVHVATPTYKAWQIAAVCVVLALITVIAYRGVTNNSFLFYDDDLYVLENQHVQQGVTLQSVEWALTGFYAANWHPLAWISHMIDWKLYGISPVGPHVTNVCLHAVNSILLFLLLLYMTGYLGRSAIVAFLFALHPAHVESVAWIAERKDLLCTLFWFLTLLAYAWYVRRTSWKRFALIICGYALALLSKPMAVTLPFTLLLLDYWPLRRIPFVQDKRGQWFPSLWKLCLEKWPLFLMAALSSIITYFAQRAGGAVVELKDLSIWGRICNAAISYLSYIRIMVWPDKLKAFYYYDYSHIDVSAAMLSVLALALITGVCWSIRKDKPYCLIGWLWFLGTLVPVIGIVQVGETALAERYTYISLIGLFIAIVWLIGDAVAKAPNIRIAAIALAVVAIAACAVKTNAQVKVWKDTTSLFTNVLDIDARGEFPNSLLGESYLRQGKLATAEEYFNRSLYYSPNWTVTLAFSADALMRTHDPHNLQLAKQRLDEAIRLAPNDPDVLFDMAEWSNLMGRPQDGEMYSRKVLATNPGFLRGRLYLADALQAQGKLDEAEQQYRDLIAIVPDNYSAHASYANVLDGKGLKQEALKEFRAALAINPDQAAAHSKIGRILTQMHQLPEAVAELTMALQIDPTDAAAHNDLGVAFFELRDYGKAAEQFGDAAKINPSYEDAKRNFALAQAHIAANGHKKG
jgi:protein O-mannosyl-transferase